MGILSFSVKPTAQTKLLKIKNREKVTGISFSYVQCTGLISLMVYNWNSLHSKWAEYNFKYVDSMVQIDFEKIPMSSGCILYLQTFGIPETLQVELVVAIEKASNKKLWQTFH